MSSSLVSVASAAAIVNSRRMQFSTYDLPVFTPKPIAFSIWGLLFTLGLLHGLIHTPSTRSLLYAFSMILCAVWPNVSHDATMSVYVVTGAFLFSFVSMIIGPKYENNYETGTLAVSLQAGWLAVATLLSIVRMLSNDSPYNSMKTFVVAACFVSLTSVVTSRPGFIAPLAWACACIDGHSRLIRSLFPLIVSCFVLSF
jgi:hypothetical protein